MQLTLQYMHAVEVLCSLLIEIRSPTKQKELVSHSDHSMAKPTQVIQTIDNDC